MSSKERIVKVLMEQAKKYGYLTYDDINKTMDEYEIGRDEIETFIEFLNERGVRIIGEKEQKELLREIEISDEIIHEEPIRMFLNEVSKIDTIDRETEISIAKNIRANEARLLSIVLSSPIAIREINNWSTLVKKNEMTPKELMKRGRKTKRSLQKMRKKLNTIVKSVNKLLKKLFFLKKKLDNKNLPLKKQVKYQNQVEKLRMKIANKIMGLELNTERIKRLIKRTKSITEKIIQYINEVKKYEQIFQVNCDTAMKLFQDHKKGKVSAAQFKRMTGYSVTAAETILNNYQKVLAKLNHYKKEFNITEDEVVKLDTQISQIVHEIEKDKLRMIQVNLNLVVSFAKKFSILTGEDINDLIQEGATGLAKAVEKFEWRKGYKFSTYAHWWVRQAISRYMAEYTKTIRLPVHIRELVSKMIKVYKTHQYKVQREITVDDYARVLKVPRKKIIDTLNVLLDPISSFTPRGQDEDSVLQDFIPSPEKETPLVQIFQSYRREVLEKAMDRFLDERERKILRMRYGLDGKEYTLEEVGKIFKITRERVRQIEAKAIRKLRSPEALEVLREVYPVKD
ncbi:MAG: sigma-70 family RNA polymerase sigma factor [Endomicrobia bacterium]|nr:sigma-70 family RNA polymerase sigma factor [Endomicrobiia bacterium]